MGSMVPAASANLDGTRALEWHRQSYKGVLRKPVYRALGTQAPLGPLAAIALLSCCSTSCIRCTAVHQMIVEVRKKRRRDC